MLINRKNYESFFIDFLDGNLSPNQEAALSDFLAKNPDLKTEIDNFDNLKLEPDKNVKFANKHLIKKTSTNATLNTQRENFISVENNFIQHQFQNQIQKNDISTQKLKKKKTLYIWAVSVAASMILFVGIFRYLNTNSEQINKYPNIVVANNNNENIIETKQNETKLQTPDDELKNSSKLTASKIDDSQNKNELTDKSKTENKHRKIKKIETPESRMCILPTPKNNAVILGIQKNTYNYQPTNTMANNGFVPLKKYLKNQLKEKIETDSVLTRKMNVWEIARAGVNGIGKITGKNLEMENKYDENNKLIAFELRGENFEISKSVKKNQK